jgi:hypothetical protein
MLRLLKLPVLLLSSRKNARVDPTRCGRARRGRTVALLSGETGFEGTEQLFAGEEFLTLLGDLALGAELGLAHRLLCRCGEGRDERRVKTAGGR